MKSRSGISPCPGKQRKCRLQFSTSISSHGASASWTRKIRSPGIAAHRGEIGLAGESVKRVEHEPDGRMIGAPHHFPGVAVVVDVTCPRPAPRSRRASRAWPRARPVHGNRRRLRSMPPSESGDTLLHTSSKSQPSSCIRSNLRSARSKVALALRLRHAFEIAERLEGDGAQAEIGHLFGNIGRRAVIGKQIAFEDFDAAETGRCDRLQLFAQTAAETNRGNRGFHCLVLRSGRIRPLRRARLRAPRSRRQRHGEAARVSGVIPVNNRNASTA